MKDNNFVDTYKKDMLGHWAKIADVKKPIIAAVNGYAVSDMWKYSSEVWGRKSWHMKKYFADMRIRVFSLLAWRWLWIGHELRRKSMV